MLPDDPPIRAQPNGSGQFLPGADGRWHGWITVGIRDDGRPDRRHVNGRPRKTSGESTRDREGARLRIIRKPTPLDGGAVADPSVENIAAPTVRPTTLAGYRSPSHPPHPGFGAHRLDRLGAEHLEKVYAKCWSRAARRARPSGRPHGPYGAQRGRPPWTSAEESCQLAERLVEDWEVDPPPSTRSAGSSTPPSNAATAPVGRSRSPWDCARAKHSACAGPTSTSTPDAWSSGATCNARSGRMAVTAPVVIGPDRARSAAT